MNNLKPLLGPMRTPFLILGPACVVVGVATAFLQTHQFNWLYILLIMIGAVSAHITVNAFNEYFDFKSGLDTKTQKTPFSGGSGTLQANPALERNTLILCLAALGITAAVGVFFTIRQGWQLLPLGLLGLLILVTYTLWWVKNPVLCLIAPGLGFGVLMVMGTHFALTGTYTWTAFIASLVPAFLVSDLLLLNQFPDVEADRTVGRKHYPITIGRGASAVIYAAFLILAYISVILGVAFGLLPWFSLIALLTVFMAWKAIRGARANAENIPALIPFMGTNVMINLITPVLLAVGVLIGAWVG